MTLSGLLSSLTLGTEKYKIDRIKKIHRWLPRRSMICIGDSTQSDPEAYGKNTFLQTMVLCWADESTKTQAMPAGRFRDGSNWS
jgi:phosphatidate phosphatase APP1